jgi:hypothetical protein
MHVTPVYKILAVHNILPIKLQSVVVVRERTWYVKKTIRHVLIDGPIPEEKPN